MKLIRILGYLGVLPFVFGLLLELKVVVIGPLWGLKLFAGYSVAILSFMAGAWWGIEIKNNFLSAVRPVGAVLLCLMAWVTLLIGSNQLSLILLAIGFLVVLAGDLSINASHYSPVYRQLRLQLSVLVLLLHGAMIVITD